MRVTLGLAPVGTKQSRLPTSGSRQRGVPAIGGTCQVPLQVRRSVSDIRPPGRPASETFLALQLLRAQDSFETVRAHFPWLCPLSGGGLVPGPSRWPTILSTGRSSDCSGGSEAGGLLRTSCASFTDRASSRALRTELRNVPSRQAVVSGRRLGPQTHDAAPLSLAQQQEGLHSWQPTVVHRPVMARVGELLSTEAVLPRQNSAPSC